MLLKHKDISRGINYSDKIKRHLGTSDIQFVHLVGIGNSYTINIYCFINKDDWELHRFVNQDIQLKIVDILKDNDTYPIGDTLKIY